MLRKKLYTALSHNDLQSLQILLEETPFVSDCSEDIDLILAEAYEEIKMKNIPLSGEIDYLVTYRLVDKNFFLPKDNKILQETNLTVQNALTRIAVIQKCSTFLSENYSNKNIDDNFVHAVRIITQHTSILKKYLKTTYEKLPWEEMEFCLLMLLKITSEHNELVNIYKLVLDKNRVLEYLKSFVEILLDLSSKFQKNDVNPKRRLPSRDAFIKSVISNNQAFKNLYEDYEIVRDIYSLNRMNYYIKHSLSFNTSDNLQLQKLVIQRTLQVIGEYLKNSAESPNVSNHVHKVLITSAPTDLRNIIVAVRDSLSHAHSLVQRFQIENVQDDFFDKLRDNLKIIQIEISIILNERKIYAFIAFSKKIKACSTLDEAKKLLKEITLTDLVFNKLDCQDFVLEEVTKIKKLVAQVNDSILDKTQEEIQLFSRIEECLELQLKKVASSENTFKSLSLNFRKTVYNMKHSNDLLYIKKIFTIVDHKIETYMQKHYNYFMTVSHYMNEIYKSLRARKLDNDFKEADDLINHLLITLDIESSSVKKIHEFKADLENDDDLLSGNSREIDNLIKNIIELEIRKDLKVKIDEGYQNKKQIPEIKAELFSMLAKIKQNESYALTEDDIKRWQKSLNILDLKEQTRNNLISYYQNKNIEGSKKLIEMIDDSYSALLKSFNDHNIFINSKQQTALRNFLTSLKLKKNDVDDVMKKFIDDLQTKIKTFFTKRFNILRDLLSCIDENDTTIVQKYLQDESFQIVVETLMLDLLEILEDMSFFTDNRLFIDIFTPVMLGKSLRNYLAHGNIFLDNLPFKPSISILCNAMKFVKCTENIIDIKDSLIGKIRLCDDSLITSRNFQHSKYIKMQQEMFLCAAKNDIEKIKECLHNGADIFASSFDGCNALHYAAETDSLESFEFLISQGLDMHLQNSSGLEPLHVAAIHGSKTIINYFLVNKLPVTVLDNGITIMHLVTEHGHLEILKELLKQNYEVNVKNFHNVTPLHLSSENGHVNIVGLLLQNRANVCDETKCSLTALHYASRNGHKEVVKLLLNYEKSVEFVNKQQSSGNSALHLAVENGHIDVVTILLNAKAEVLLKNKMGYTPICISVQFGHLHIFKMLYSSLQDKQSVDRKELLTWACHNGHSSIARFLLETEKNSNDLLISGSSFLIIAVEKGHEDVVKVLLASGAQVNMPNDKKRTPLHFASQNGFSNMVNDLLDAKAEVNCLDDAGLTPLCLAALFDHVEIIDTLIKNGADVNLTAIRKITPLHAAVHAENNKVVNILLQARAIVNAQTDKGITPLHLACIFGINEIVCELLKADADVNIKTENNYTPLHFACREGHKMVVDTLLKNYANINAETVKKSQSQMSQENYEIMFSHTWCDGGSTLNIRGLTPLHFAAQNGWYDIVESLLNKGAHFDVPDEKNVTPLVLAAQNGFTKIVNLFISKGANVNIKLKDNLTPLMITVHGDYKKTVESLLKAGASVDSANINGFTSLHFAALFGYNSIMRILISHGANKNSYALSSLTPLHLAVMSGNKDGVEILIKSGADIDDNRNGYAPLEFAVYLGMRNIVNILYESGAAINPKTHPKIIHTTNSIQSGTNKQVNEMLYTANEVEKELKSTPLLTAVSQDFYDIVCDLLLYGADPNIPNEDMRFPLHIACLKGQINTVKKLLEYQADLEARSAEGFTPLLAAVQGNHIEVVKLLLKAGAKVDVRNIEDATPLSMAVVRGSEEIIEELLKYQAAIDQGIDCVAPLYLACKHNCFGKAKVLVKYGADINIKTKQLWTPLHVAASNGNREIVRLLLDNKADFKSVTIEGVRALHLAAQNGHSNIVQELLSRGDDVDVITLDDNSTPLNLASFYGHLETVEMLLKFDANINVPNVNGMTPLHIAVIKNHPAIVKTLLRAGADSNSEANPNLKPLHIAVMKFYKEIICELLIHGAVIDEKSEILMEKERFKRDLMMDTYVEVEVCPTLNSFCSERFFKPTVTSIPMTVKALYNSAVPINVDKIKNLLELTSFLRTNEAVIYYHSLVPAQGTCHYQENEED